MLWCYYFDGECNFFIIYRGIIAFETSIFKPITVNDIGIITDPSRTRWEGLEFVKLRSKLHFEECDELNEELWDGFAREKVRPNLLKEGADLLYVLLGTFVSLGLGDQLIEAFKRVHESNMSKLDENGKPIYREDGKVLKGPNYKLPVLDNLV